MPRLTVASIEAFSRSDARKLSDTQKGLVLRKKAGWPTFYIRMQVSGRDTLWFLGAWRRELELDDARRLTSDLLFDLQRGLPIGDEHISKKRISLGLDSEIVAPATKPLFGQAVQDYLRHVKAQRAEATWWDYSKAFREPGLKPLENKAIDRVSREDLAEIIDEISLSGRQRTAEKLAVILSGMWTYLAHDAHIRKYGVERAMLFRFKPIERKGTKVPKVTPTAAEIHVLLATGMSGISEQMRAAATLLLLTGQRITTVSKARREHFTTEPLPETDRNVRVWRMPNENMKSKRPHALPLPERAWWVVERVESGWLFPAESGSGHMDPGSITKLFGSRYLDLPYSPHRVRTTMTAAIRKASLGRLAPKLILDHAEARTGDVTLEHYDEDEELEDKEKALDAWMATIDKAGAEKA